MTTSHPKPLLLCILDGWGNNPSEKDNAIAAAYTPHWDALIATSSHSALHTSGLDVGLPTGQMGNSEVGHMNIGSGRIVMQELPRIDLAIENGSIEQAPALQKLIATLKASKGTCHLVGLLSPGGVHSHQLHMLALTKIIVNAGIPVAIHAALDGRDTPPKSAKEYVAAFEQDLLEAKISAMARIVTISGRYYAMDRDKRWDRVQLAYDVIVNAKGNRANSTLEAIEASYKTEKTDEFILPTVIGDYQGVSDNDGLMMANFRSDRARQMLHALCDPAFDGFVRSSNVNWKAIAGMVEYSSALSSLVPACFPPQELKNILGEIIANHGMKQLRIAETEKYAHVTFFFNGGREEPFAGEERILVPSPKVATYDLQPEMSAPEVTAKLVDAIRSGKYDLIVANYANTDMVGHTGIQSAAVKAVEAVDYALGQLSAVIQEVGGVMLISADHGNAEMMTDHHTGEPHTAHTTYSVPFVLVGEAVKHLRVSDGRLCDIAPTILEIMGIAIPKDMNGQSLITK